MKTNTQALLIVAIGSFLVLLSCSKSSNQPCEVSGGNGCLPTMTVNAFLSIRMALQLVEVEAASRHIIVMMAVSFHIIILQQGPSMCLMCSICIPIAPSLLKQDQETVLQPIVP
jgi:hypothetical protein